MNKCFCKKLLGVLNDDTLSRVGEIRVELSNDSSQSLSLLVRNLGEYYIRTVGDCEIYSGAGDISRGKKYEFSDSITYMLKGSGLVFIYDGYDSKKLTLTANQSFDIEQVLCRPALEELIAGSSTIKGNLDDALKGISTLKVVRLNGTSFDGYNITSICGNKSLSEFLVGEKANGKLEDFVEGLLESGKTSGSISMYIQGSNVTINNSLFTPSERITITFNSATSVVVTRTTGSAVMATYSNGTWSY